MAARLEWTPMPPRRWKHLEGAIIGFLVGLFSYVAVALSDPVNHEPLSRLKWLAAYCLGGAVVGYIAVRVRNRLVWRNFMGEEQRRGIMLDQKGRPRK
ncbi:hypothetical protein G7078_08575 [Sphingomonas sinipercae]|uniref:Uncharacterized protein n=1 Tax=Sphingomonas sinipercae TaxID=2714944 RepID=A0A6G7ZPD7_9SPHN|nr:hypothetical protein [Sphingomonas sinipercae]QIL02831.1 hypothetical protein G7078_08575 [Sphingomonas sinipercae]